MAAHHGRKRRAVYIAFVLQTASIVRVTSVVAMPEIVAHGELAYWLAWLWARNCASRSRS